MTRTADRTSRPTRSVGRALLVGFLVGAGVAVPMAVFALVWAWAEELLDYVVPGAVLLRPLAPDMADWHGAVNMALVCLANGLVYALVAAAVVWLLALARQRR